MHNEHWKTGHQHLFQFFEYKGQNPEKPPKLSLVRYTDGTMCCISGTTSLRFSITIDQDEE